MSEDDDIVMVTMVLKLLFNICCFTMYFQDVAEFEWRQSNQKTRVWRKNLADISYTSRFIAYVVSIIGFMV